MREYAIIGGGIGGCASAALLNASGKDVVLFEKEPYLGGCASTFRHKNRYYNTGATTLCGYGEGRIVRKLFDQVGVNPDLIRSDPSIVVIHGDKTIPRYQDVERFIQVINEAYPHPKHTDFWHLIYMLATEFYTMEGYYYSNASRIQKLYSLCSFYPLLRKFWRYLFEDATTFIRRFYGTLDPYYLDFLDAQILIVSQVKSDSVNFLTCALALGYTFETNYYAVGGMGKVCETLTSKISDVHLSHPITSIQKTDKGFQILSHRESIEAKAIIMGTSYFESSQWIHESNINSYYKRYEHLNNHQSAFLLYLTIPNSREFAHHYQLISDNMIPFTLSKSLFVSISDPNDTKLSSDSTLSVTASIHTDERIWLSLPKPEYTHQKEHLATLLTQWICDTLMIDEHSILERFAATPKTFGRYINRTQLGGIPMHRHNLLPNLPSNDTPIEDFYTVGDTSYAAQGWPGVVMGAFNLMKVIR